MSVPHLLKAGLTALAVAGSILAGSSASAAQLPPRAEEATWGHDSAPVTTQAVQWCGEMVYLGNGDDAWEQTCTVDDGGGTPTTRCLSRVGTGNYYDVYGEWLGRGTWTFTGFPCQPGDFLVQGYVQ